MIRKTSIIILSFVLGITQTVFSGPVISKSQKHTDFICQPAFLRNIGLLLLDHDEFMYRLQREQEEDALQHKYNFSEEDFKEKKKKEFPSLNAENSNIEEMVFGPFCAFKKMEKQEMKTFYEMQQLQEKKACVEREQQRGLLNTLLLYLEIKEDAQTETLNDLISLLDQTEKRLKTFYTQEKWSHFYLEYETLIPRYGQPMRWLLYKNNNEKKCLLEERKKDFRKIEKIWAQHKASICNPSLRRAYISEDDEEHMSEE